MIWCTERNKCAAVLNNLQKNEYYDKRVVVVVVVSFVIIISYSTLVPMTCTNLRTSIDRNLVHNGSMNFLNEYKKPLSSITLYLVLLRIYTQNTRIGNIVILFDMNGQKHMTSIENFC